MNETIKIADIVIGERLRKDYGDLGDLDSVSTVGLIQPIVLDKSNEGIYRLVAGGRRLSKLKELGLTEVEHGVTSVAGKAGFVYAHELPEDVQREIELYENIGRKGMSWQERVMAIAEIHQLKKTRAAKDGEYWGQAETGAEVGLTYSSVSYALTVAERLRNPESRFWKCSGLTEALKLLVEERENVANRQKAELTAKVIPVPLNNSKEQQEIAIVESLERGDTITVPLSRMLLKGKMENLYRRFENGIDHIITDWPYATEMDNLQQSQGGINVRRVEAEHDVDKNLLDYPVWMDALWKMLKPKSFCVIWYDNVHWQFIRDLAEAVGFRVQRWPLVWVKTSPCLNQMANKNFTKATEFAIVLSKQNATLIKPQPVNYWSGPRSANVSNPFAKPKGLWQWVLSSFALQGDVIADPFMGEASSLLAAVDFGCRVVGMEVAEHHYNNGVNNIRSLYEKLTNNNVQFT
jgi:DNA modification methylase